MAGVLLSLAAGNVLAERIQWAVEDGGNGHYYEGFDATVTWSEANRLAKALGGHLATVTSDEENDLFLLHPIYVPPISSVAIPV
jgi:hypothetical protein